MLQLRDALLSDIKLKNLQAVTEHEKHVIVFDLITFN